MTERGIPVGRGTAGWHRCLRWMYRGGRPNRLARLLNRMSAWQFAAGLLAHPNWVTLEVPGRRTGRPVALPLVVADLDGERYLVSMLGPDANWVRNVRAASGRAVLRRHGGREPVRLRAVPAARRAPILRRYLDLAPGARPHLPVRQGAPLAEFERVAARFPVFRITPDPPDLPAPPDPPDLPDLPGPPPGVPGGVGP
ncbi:nitroreductase/quinone reductase family protein [Micromonospora sp. WMMD1102]|uniref:nitroreductase/quinone reductase family protein n=1 Tax=Micromonospora sp. WMMD1102 TaxID=3016105 RepID=UPI0024155695|nr:nitroreductase/quinone reductase family protein [Micromonospora sp. WMMD1102]MDG4786699.1 nitroreductase/quinone reductase family protein [Micromonospora sp. WMMD1102]